MALGALSQGIDVSIVPVGLTYFHPHKFRSRAVVEFGDPVNVPESIVKDFQEGKRRESIGGLLSSIRDALLAVTMTAPDIETMMVGDSNCFCKTLLTFLARSYCAASLLLTKKACSTISSP